MENIKEFLRELRDYKRTLEGFESCSSDHGFCFHLPYIFTHKFYPRLWKYKPWYVFAYHSKYQVEERYSFFNFLANPFEERGKLFWFPKKAQEKRKRILRKIIAEMEAILYLREKYLKGKILIYKTALAKLIEFKKQSPIAWTGFCRVLNMPLTKENYPELMKHKPYYVEEIGKGRFHNPTLGPSGYWFHPVDHEKREEILNLIINKLTEEWTEISKIMETSSKL